MFTFFKVVALKVLAIGNFLGLQTDMFFTN